MKAENYTSKLEIKGRMPHLDFLGCLESSIERSCVIKKRSNARLTCTKDDPKVTLKKEPVSVAESTCWLNLTRTYSGELANNNSY